MGLFELVDYWQSVGLYKMARIFWYFIIFELTRYVLFDSFILLIFKLTKKSRSKIWDRARRDFYNERPLISVIAPGKNEGKNIFKLVKSLSEQTYQNFEIIIVDDGSDDETPIIGKNLEKNGLIDVFIRNRMRGGKASAANLALRYCTGKFCLHLDADSSFDRDAVERIMIPFYIDPEIGGVGGNVKVRNYNDSLCARLQAIEYLKTISTGRIVTSFLGILQDYFWCIRSLSNGCIKTSGRMGYRPGTRWRHHRET